MSRVDKLTIAFLTIVFSFAGVDKLVHLQGFVKAINSYRILPIPMGTLLAPVVIAAELTIAIGLLRLAWRRVAAASAVVLLISLTGALTVNQMLGAEGICGCWFSINMAEGNLHLTLNAMMIAMSLFVWQASPRPGDRATPKIAAVEPRQLSIN